MNDRRAVGYIFFCLIAILITVSGVCATTWAFETSTATPQLTANTVQITVTQSDHGTIFPGTTTVNLGANPTFKITPDTNYHISSITANGVAVPVTSPSGQSYQFSYISVPSSLTATFAINTPSLGLVLAAVIIAVTMIFIYKLPENKYKITILTHYEKQEIASLKSTLEKIKSLEEEKKSLLLKIDELKKISEAKATALESEVNALQDEVKSLKIQTTEQEPRTEQEQKNRKNKTS